MIEFSSSANVKRFHCLSCFKALYGSNVTVGMLPPIGGTGDNAHFPRSYLNIEICTGIIHWYIFLYASIL